jgi:hypothetical protein
MKLNAIQYSDIIFTYNLVLAYVVRMVTGCRNQKVNRYRLGKGITLVSEGLQSNYMKKKLNLNVGLRYK